MHADLFGSNGSVPGSIREISVHPRPSSTVTTCAQSFVLPLKGGQPVQQIQDDRNAREVYAQRFAEASDHAQSRDGRRIKKRPRAFLLDRLYQSELHKSFDQRGVHARARGQHVERQLLTLVPAKNKLVSPHGHHLPPGINSRALKRDSAASFSKSSFSLAVSLDGMTMLSFTNSSPRPPPRRFNPCPRN